MSIVNQENIKLYREIVELATEAVAEMRSENVLVQAGLLDRVFSKLEEAYTFIPKEKAELFLPLINDISESTGTKDDILTADYFESSLIPFFNTLIKDEITTMDPSELQIEIDDETSVEITSSGEYTIKFRGKYLHSNNFPGIEAARLAQAWDDPVEKTCMIWGLGLGYHVLKMFEIDSYREIFVFEPEEKIIKLCEKYGVLKAIKSQKRAHVLLDPNGKEYVKCAESHSNSRLFIHRPTLETMKDSPLKSSLEKYFAHFVSRESQKRSYIMSFRENTSIEFKGLPDLQFNPEAKKAIIVSAGPSLDKNYLLLKEKKKETVIIATAPTMRKLYKADIIPDCTVISDTKPELKKLHEGAEDALCPLVYSSTASVPFVADHKGPRYILCQKGFEPAEALAQKNNWPVIDSYGSVALTALVLAVEKGFKEIIFIGQDLCYKGNQMHASDTTTHHAIEEPGRIVTTDIFGDRVTVPVNLSIFKVQIEEVVKKHPEIAFINATEGGLHLEGVPDKHLAEVL